jgi:hypothetical protein
VELNLLRVKRARRGRIMEEEGLEGLQMVEALWGDTRLIREVESSASMVTV